jgi:HD-GYP domain-containing protein (c-di-GMP phosphodiesterase class II)
VGATIEGLERHAGSHFDPAVVRALVAVVSRTEPTDTSVTSALLAA